ncbi:MAG: oxygen-independent coproporphyrinogen III oxidase [Aquabacterium sp.]|uniref:oxygen-independent coproporphyrinogen III oxidase n=1 Tax=Aquabacterium sp. TaxID=1872578 RepID=UPI00271C19E1|nr:oxygen-independent coproporphyrinogen III oxidase [Aquabacterium sp.]MDO9003390.1 oxygen-independent coproporphyrinogen III oxidase [Aquabacterium sp.]
MSSSSSVELDSRLLQRLDKSGPRYTSYPTADRFHDRFKSKDYELALRERADGLEAGLAISPLSVYVHVPFCESVCYYCACNKVVTRDHTRATKYLDMIEREVELHLRAWRQPQQASQLHLGGGTPTFLSDAEISRLMSILRRAVSFSPDAEMSIEVDPRTVTPQRLAKLANLGFNRLSFGVQDFNEQVQAAVHRLQPFESVRDLMESARSLGYGSINMDLIYGLPKQTPESFARTLGQVAQLRPDRIALYGYAHMPERFKPQRRILTPDLPTPVQRINMLEQAIKCFKAEGYDYIGMDHFALPNDSLAVAKRQGRLQRNFQGYSTQPDCDIVALGVSAIGRVGASYSQNAKTLDQYEAALLHGHFPTEKGLRLSSDDLIRRTVVMALMCQGRLDFDAIEKTCGIKVPDYFKPELARLQAMAEEGMLVIEPRAVQLTPLGWHFVRNVSMVFDRYLG